MQTISGGHWVMSDGSDAGLSRRTRGNQRPVTLYLSGSVGVKVQISWLLLSIKVIRAGYFLERRKIQRSGYPLKNIDL